MITLIAKTPRPETTETTLRLPWEKRVRSRLRVRLDSGEEAALLLPHGTVLRGGDTLISAEGRTALVVAAAEKVSTVRAASAIALARLGYHLGNRHVAVEIGNDYLRYLHDHVLDAMVVGLGGTVSVEELPFEPEPGAYAGSHHHGHAPAGGAENRHG